MSEKYPAYSIQQTYIIKSVSKSEKRILTCDQRIDIPTIEPLSNVELISSDNDIPLIVIPCIELAGEFLSEFDLTFETNEGVTVLPIKIASGQDDPSENPYTHFRYVLALPSGATGVRTCKLIQKATGKEVQHNCTFGILPPPYNYDNALFGYISYAVKDNRDFINRIIYAVKDLKVSATSPYTAPAQLFKGQGIQTIYISKEDLFFYAQFNYPLSSEPTLHKPKISLIADEDNFYYTLSLNKARNTVSIDLFTGMITAYDSDNGEIIQQFMINRRNINFKSIKFGDFDDIDDNILTVYVRGALLNV